ncbi:gp84-like protein [Phenacoccus solenopsis nudivirus]|nr:gp84-like protein [Phenacoccus solenopsis nudivirus]
MNSTVESQNNLAKLSYDLHNRILNDTIKRNTTFGNVRQHVRKPFQSDIERDDERARFFKMVYDGYDIESSTRKTKFHYRVCRMGSRFTGLDTRHCLNLVNSLMRTYDNSGVFMDVGKCMSLAAIEEFRDMRPHDDRKNVFIIDPLNGIASASLSSLMSSIRTSSSSSSSTNASNTNGASNNRTESFQMSTLPKFGTCLPETASSTEQQTRDDATIKCTASAPLLYDLLNDVDTSRRLNEMHYREFDDQPFGLPCKKRRFEPSYEDEASLYFDKELQLEYRALNGKSTAPSNAATASNIDGIYRYAINREIQTECSLLKRLFSARNNRDARGMCNAYTRPTTSDIYERNIYNYYACGQQQQQQHQTTCKSSIANIDLYADTDNLALLDGVVATDEFNTDEYIRRDFDADKPVSCAQTLRDRNANNVRLFRELSQYRNRLCIMAINVQRYLYTLDFIRMTRGENTSRSNLALYALHYYIDYDIRRVHRLAKTFSRLNPNIVTDARSTPSVRNVDRLSYSAANAHLFENTLLPESVVFSTLLKLLTQSGYIDYIFDLAYRLLYNVDIVFATDNASILHRYEHEVYNRNATEGNPSPKVAINGYINVFVDQDRWYVKVCKFSLFS